MSLSAVFINLHHFYFSQRIFEVLLESVPPELQFLRPQLNLCGLFAIPKTLNLRRQVQPKPLSYLYSIPLSEIQCPPPTWQLTGKYPQE